ncbi:MAG: hypothetical protein GXO74_06600 [Calditrichaeota bacterium]|nr:hypothetical protein [Calditrichota bacterium]
MMEKTSFLFFFLFFTRIALCQNNEPVLQQNQYQIGPDQRLLITVHIFGEVKNPGEYLVPDDTNVLELISKAGGPTEFSDLGKIKITRGLLDVAEVKNLIKTRSQNRNDKRIYYKKQIIKINLKKLLDKEDYNIALPTMKPGDVVRVGRNKMFAWQTIIQVISQIALVAQVWYWYSRSN